MVQRYGRNRKGSIRVPELFQKMDLVASFQSEARGESVMEVPHGYCHCGCGKKTNINRQTRSHRGISRGDPSRFLHGHWARGHPFEGRKTRDAWTTIVNHRGYAETWSPDHPRSTVRK